jgi:hypothetical protein
MIPEVKSLGDFFSKKLSLSRAFVYNISVNYPLPKANGLPASSSSSM